MKFSKHYFLGVIFLCKGKYNTIQCNRHYFAMIHSQTNNPGRMWKNKLPITVGPMYCTVSVYFTSF